LLLPWSDSWLEIVSRAESSSGKIGQKNAKQLEVAAHPLPIAFLACGFVDPIEARYAIAAVLEVIEMHDSMPESP
jgi:hypothetical protein